MTVRPIFRPTPTLRAVCKITASLVGKTAPTKSRAILYFGHSLIYIFREAVHDDHGTN